MPDVEWISRGAERVLKDFDAVVKKTEQHENATKGTTKATEELGRISGKILKDQETAWQKYERQVVNAKRALDNNLLSEKEMSREHARATIELLRETDAVDKNTAARNRALAVKRQQARLADVYRLETLRGVSVIKDETAALGEMTVELGNFANKAKMVGGEWSALAGTAARLAPFIGGAAIYSSMQADQAASSAAGGRAIASGRAAAGLTELAGGDPKKLRQLMALSRASFLEGGFAGGDESGAHRLTFELESGGMSGERKFFSDLQKGGWDSAGIAKQIGTYRQGFRGGDAVGTSEQILSKAMQAGALAPGANIEDILRGATTSASTAKSIGISDEENMAFIGLLAETTGSGEQAGTLASSLYRSIVSQGLADKGHKSLPQYLSSIQGKNLLQSELQKTLGREEAARAFSMATDPAVLQNRIQSQRRASIGGQARVAVGQAMAIPSVATGIAVNQDDAAAQIEEQEEGLRTQRVESHHRRIGAAARDALPGIVSGPFNLGLHLLGPVIPDAWEDPGTYDRTAPSQMDAMAALLDETRRANSTRDRQLREQKKQSRRRGLAE